MYSHSNDKTIAKLRYSLNETKEDIIILGSSRAQHHYNSTIIANKTGLTVFNAGFGGQGLKFSFIQLHEQLKRYTPKIVVVDIAPNILLDKESDDKLNILLPYTLKSNLVYNELNRNNQFLKVKTISNCYPYNSNIFALLKSQFLKRKGEIKNLGYYPLEGIIDTISIENILSNSIEAGNIQNESLKYLDKIISLCEASSIKCYIVISPYFLINNNLNGQIKQIKKYIVRYNSIEVVDYSCDSIFYQRLEYFKDYAHMNNQGAKEFSNLVSNQIVKSK